MGRFVVYLINFSFRVVTRESGETLRESGKTWFSPLPTGLPRTPFPSPSPFSLYLALSPAEEILAEAVIFGFSSGRVRIAFHLIECTLALVGAHFGGAFWFWWDGGFGFLTYSIFSPCFCGVFCVFSIDIAGVLCYNRLTKGDMKYGDIR